MSKLKDKIRMFVIENFLFDDNGDLADSTSFLEHGIIDSTGILELVAFIEENFEITVKDDELIPENLDSIANVARYIQESVGDRNGIF
jgi:acyl carrier protein